MPSRRLAVLALTLVTTSGIFAETAVAAPVPAAESAGLAALATSAAASSGSTGSADAAGRSSSKSKKTAASGRVPAARRWSPRLAVPSRRRWSRRISIAPTELTTTQPKATALSAGATSAPRRFTPTLARKILGTQRSQTPWFSGAWTGGYMSGARAEAFGRWRGTPLDAVTTYPEKRTWASLADSRWHLTTYANSPARLVYGLPLLPETGPGTLSDVARGRYDHVFTAIGRDFRVAKRGNSIVRVGFEANGTWTRYGGTAANAATWKAAYRRVVRLLKAQAPGLVIDFDITCGFAMPGSRNRLDSLTKLYPGDDVVDLVGCDMYDEWQTGARTAAEFQRALRPAASPGLVDIAAFARAHRKGMSIPEWGVAGRQRGGNGDNPYFIRAMRAWMVAHRDVLVLENYFNDPVADIRSDLWGGQNRLSASAYRAAW